MRLPPLAVIAVAIVLMWVVARIGPTAEIPANECLSLIFGRIRSGPMHRWRCCVTPRAYDRQSADARRRDRARDGRP